MLHSNPGANHTIYLDFDGHSTQGTTWNSNYGVSTINSPAYDIDGNPSTFSQAELTRIENVWEIVSEDFIPFNIDVTTEDPGPDALRYSGGGDTQWGVRVVITDDTFANCGCGGHAYIGSFDDPTDEPVFVYNSSQTGVSEASSHEVGHALLLSHDGTSGVTYYSGHGSGETSWGALMGASYNRNVTQWSQGEFVGANNTGSGANYGNGPDDLAIIASLSNGNGFGVRADDHGDNSASATGLSLSGQNVTGSGIIERTTDVDVFSFVTGAGNIQLNIDTVDLGPNLDIRAELRDSDDSIVAVSDVASVLDASFNLSVPAGQYTLHVMGTGTGNPLSSSPSGYTEYGSLGRFFVSGTVVESNAVVISLAATDDSAAELGQDPGTFTFTRTGDLSGEVTINYTLAGTADNVADYSELFGSVTILDNQSIATVTVTPVDDGESEGNETVVLTIAPDAAYLIGSPSTDTVTIADDDLTYIDEFASSFNVIDGSIAGSLTDTYSDNDTYQVITEELYAGRKRSRMQTRWTFDVTGGNSVTFFVEAHHDSSNEDFDFEYSTDGSSWTHMLTVDSNSDNGLPQTYDLPGPLSGNVFVRAIDTDRSRNENTQDSLFVDEMFIRTSLGGDPLPQVSITASDSNAAEEGLDPGEFTVSRTGDLIGNLLVYYTIDGTADNGTDYGALTGSVTIADGNAFAIIQINPNDDVAPEGTENVVLILQNDAAYMVTNPNSNTVSIADNDVVSSDDYAVSDNNAYGTVSGTLAATTVSDGNYEAITEELFAGNKRSRLLHQWSFDVTSGNAVTFFVEAHHNNGSVDDFDFEYSTDGSSWTHMLTVNKTSDDDTTQNFVLPNSTSGTVVVRVVDTNRGKEAALDTIFVDEMYISSVNSGAPVQSAIEIDHQDPKWMFESGHKIHVNDQSVDHGSQFKTIGRELDQRWRQDVGNLMFSYGELDRQLTSVNELARSASNFREQLKNSNERNLDALPLFAERIQLDHASRDWGIDYYSESEQDDNPFDFISATLDQLFTDLENWEFGII